MTNSPWAANRPLLCHNFGMDIPTPIAISLLFVVVFVVCFVIGLVLTISLLVKASKLKRLLLDSGYPPEKLAGLLPARDQMQNFRDSTKRSMFSFEWFLISRFGEDVLVKAEGDEYRATVDSMRKTHRAYTRCLVACFAAVILAMATLFFGSQFV